MKINPVVLSVVSAAVLIFGPAASSTSAQPAVPSPAQLYQPLSDQQLDQLLAPIALYPDPLLAQLLPASTLPTEIVLADRYVVGGGDPNLIAEQEWDSSVQALARYPAVLQYLDKYLAWTTQIGQAFINQQQQVMESIQRLRASAQNYGNLVSTPQEEVVDDGGDIEIEPVDPAVIYVPVYDPAIIYYESGCAWSFGVGCTLGVWLDGDFDWHRHHIYFWGPNQPRPIGWWHQSPTQRRGWLAQQGTVWQPGNRGNRNGTHGGDRGWNLPTTTAPRVGPTGGYGGGAQPGHPGTNPRQPGTQRPVAGQSPRGINAENPVRPPVREEGHSAFIGSSSSEQAREFSNRGGESIHVVEHSEPAHVEAPVEHSAPPVEHSAPAAESHSSGSQPRR
jgi:hypothetical protein